MSDIYEHLFEKSGDLVADLMKDANEIIDHDALDSPMESLFALAAAIKIRVGFKNLEWYPEGILDLGDARNFADLDGDSGAYELGTYPGCHGMMFTQVNVGKYRVDFLLLHRFGLDDAGAIAIEIDGHEFHEKTKEQAARDKKRDRELQKLGIKVFRFTGSEVWKDPYGCAHQVLSVGDEIARKSVDARQLHDIGSYKAAKINLDELRFRSWPL
jgi:very-short-patch-repair endonuclease